jgi:hypothetical protein
VEATDFSPDAIVYEHERFLQEILDNLLTTISSRSVPQSEYGLSIQYRTALRQLDGEWEDLQSSKIRNIMLYILALGGRGIFWLAPFPLTGSCTHAIICPS